MRDINQVVNDYYKRIYKICLFYLRNNRQDAEEAVQQIFVTIMEKLHTFKEESNIYTWIYRIAINTLKNIIQRRRIVQFISWENLPGHHVANFETGNDPAYLLESQQQKMIQISYLEDAIHQLSHRERTAFYLYYYEQMKQKEIAGIMDTTVSAVESLIHKSKEKIKKRIPQYEN